jgi:hypothetical protein
VRLDGVVDRTSSWHIELAHRAGASSARLVSVLERRSRATRRAER